MYFRVAFEADLGMDETRVTITSYRAHQFHLFENNQFCSNGDRMERCL